MRNVKGGGWGGLGVEGTVHDENVTNDFEVFIHDTEQTRLS